MVLLSLCLGQNACPANYSSQMRFADPVICNQYVQCVDGHLEQRTCSNNLLFDRITKTCKPYEQAECHGSKPEPVSLTSTSTASTCKSPAAHGLCSMHKTFPFSNQSGEHGREYRSAGRGQEATIDSLQLHGYVSSVLVFLVFARVFRCR